MKAFFIFIGVWFIASLLNGLLSGICIAVFEKDTFNTAAGMILLSCIFSFVFSMPLVILVWLITTIARAYGRKGHSLFQIILNAAFFCALTGAILFINTLGNEFKEARFATGFCIIISALGAILFFRNQLKTNE
jgi:ABC-type methionine transport system permease subunit